MNNIQKDVAAFMDKAGQKRNTTPSIPRKERRILHAKLILEECLETIAAMGLQMKSGGELEAVGEMDLEETYDGLVDLQYVLYGAANSFGLDMELGHKEVHKANMNKFAPGGYRREDGKWIKPKDWVAPNLKQFL